MDPISYVSHSDLERIFFKYFYKVYLWAPLVISALVYRGTVTKDVTDNFFILFIVIFASVVFCFFIYAIHKRLAYKIILNFEEEKILFYMLMDNEIVTINFEDIIKVEVRQYLHFYSKDNKISYNYGTQSNKVEMVNVLEEIFDVKISILGDVARILRRK